VNDAATILPRLYVGVTAHRDLVESEESGLEDRVRAFFSGLQREYPDLPLRLLSPLAEGGDQLVARVALSMDIPLIAVLPMSRRDYEADFKSEEALSSFRSLLTGARQVIELPAASGGPPAVDAPARARQTQYAQVGVFISEHSQVLLALWDGKEGEEFGGTGQVVRYHLGGDMEGISGDPTPA